MRESVIAVGCIVGFFLLIAALGRSTKESATAVNDNVRIGQLTAEVAGARSEANTLRNELEKCREDLKQAKDANEALKSKITALEKKLASKAK